MGLRVARGRRWGMSTMDARVPGGVGLGDCSCWPHTAQALTLPQPLINKGTLDSQLEVMALTVESTKTALRKLLLASCCPSISIVETVSFRSRWLPKGCRGGQGGGWG